MGLGVDRLEINPFRAKAVEDARQMQSKVNEQCRKTGKDPPPYGLEELIGKGSFGRVYKGKDMRSAAVVAIKIIDIDESDTVNPRNADAYSDVLKEISALSILSETKAKNINYVIEALNIGQSIWLITDHCSGGSVATLMKPTFPAGLQEKWIIPILREVAEAIKYVHAAGIIHRDIKCANVLITELGGVQLCDFGIAAVIESQSDKRSTIIGTPHWMAPELLTGSASYGKEVDIWAFGAMVYEVATGLPPNVANGIPYERLGTHLKKNVPRLEGADYSVELRNLIAYCLEEEPTARPNIEDVQKHPYIFNTASTYPTSSLRALIGSFKIWESRGGSRKSLFMQHGAKGLSSDNPSANYEWNFSTTEYFDREVFDEFSTRDVYDAYGLAALDFDEDTAKPQKTARPTRRRAPPESLSRIPAQPLEKIFDPNTLSNYDDNSRAQYGGNTIRKQHSDLPLRDNSVQPPIKDNMIDLGDHNFETGISSFSGIPTIRPDRSVQIDEDAYLSSADMDWQPKYNSVDENKKRRTQDWKFPTLPAVSDVTKFPIADEVEKSPAGVSKVESRPLAIHHTPEPLGMLGGNLKSETGTDRSSIQSLIDLDMSLPDPIRDFSRPSTAVSEVNSMTGEQMPVINPFEYEQHQYVNHKTREREPSLYVTENEVPFLQNNVQEISEVSDISISETHGVQAQSPHSASDEKCNTLLSPISPLSSCNIPEIPSGSSLTGTASADEMKSELSRILKEMTLKLDAFRESYDALETPIS